jgi:lipopolysaccharide/colanic/teichoic acid biosynthesis glycosyltransferase
VTKRVLDLLLTVATAPVWLPIMAVIAILVRWRLGTPVLFRQRRPGFQGVPFELVKFRTMRDAVDERGRPFPDAERLTPFGSWLRATSPLERPAR